MLSVRKAAPALSGKSSSDAVPVNASDPEANGSNGRAPSSATVGPGRSILGRSIRVKGELRLDEELRIEGEFEGSLHVSYHRVSIGPEAHVKSDIQAREAIIEGTLEGNISAQRIEIGETGRVTGDLVAPSIAIEAGAYYKGQIEILTQETKGPAQ